MSSNKEKFAEIYVDSFAICYPRIPVLEHRELIRQACRRACDNIRGIRIDGAAFKLTARRLGIEYTYKAFEAFLNEAH
jgi:hypothetical protein